MMKGNRFIFPMLILSAAVFCLPITQGAQSSFKFVEEAHALSAESMPLGSNIFVEIAKKQNPAVVNISIKGKSEGPRQRMAPPNPRGRHPRDRNPGGPGAPGGPNQRMDPFRDFYDRFFGEREPRPKRGMGSGFVIDNEGHILTNYHVVDGADEITVNIQEGDKELEMSATLIGKDSKTDIALIKLVPEPGQTHSFPHLNFGDSDKLEVGEWVMAIGNPFGLSHTVTVGVVSAKDRSIGAGPYDEYIQTDASINPGNSGGPLINIKGEVIGINTAIISGNTGGNVGIGFAIPINVAKGILKDLREKGTVTRGWLGVMIQKITPDLAKSFNLKETDGALVGDVIPSGPAARAGIERGDVIVSFNGEPVVEMEELPKIVAATSPGKQVDVIVIRNGQRKTIKVTLEVLKDEPVKVASLDTMGLQVQDITPELAQSLKLDLKEGVLVSDVTAGKSAAEAGMRRGDVITEVNRKAIRTTADYRRETQNLKSGDTALMLVRRGGSTIYVAVKLQ